MSRVGIELTPEVLRVVELRRFGTGIARCHEVPWDPAAPAAGVAAARAHLGAVDAIAVAVGLGLISVTRVELPPASDEARERMVALEPERFFATTDALTTAIAPGTELAFAVPTSRLEQWLAALTTWAPVTRVDPSPVALARAMAATKGTGAGGGTRTYEVEAGRSDRGLVTLRGGGLIAARRVAPDVAEEAAPLAEREGVEPRYLSALGAARGDEEVQPGTLWSEERRRGARRAAARQTATALLAAAAGLVLAAAAFDRWRERTLIALEREAGRLAAAAAPALAAQQRLQRLTREEAIVRDVVAKRSDPAAVLAAISVALPGDAVVTTARGTGRSWQIDGTARSVAPLVPRLDQSGAFDNVRSLAASARFLDGNRSRETFSLAFDVRPRP
jgi:Tfp pilus assembly protein PilN